MSVDTHELFTDSEKRRKNTEEMLRDNASRNGHLVEDNLDRWHRENPARFWRGVLVIAGIVIGMLMILSALGPRIQMIWP